MTRTFLSLRRFLLPLLGLILHTALPAYAEECDDPNPLRLALIPKKNPETLAAEYQPLIQLLEKKLARPVLLQSAPSYGTVIEALLAGRADLAELGPAAYAMVKKRAPETVAFASFSLQHGPHTPSGNHYQALLIVRQERPFKKPEDLRGATLSLTDPASTSGALIPSQIFAQRLGMPLHSHFKRVSYAGSHDRAILSVQRRQVDAAFVSSSRLDEAMRKGSVAPGEIAVLWKSDPIPYDPFVHRGRLCAPLAAKIRQAFLNNNEALSGMFHNLQMTGFIPVDDERYRDIRQLYDNQPPK
ncbi:phosphate/phosphite/phosphonate ABC transporter substrate-binding protein [Dechloromonas sp. ARDL1]|uniref:phosphate/phosphite/phosphonate ABC transporter substrate-binding protein n=1 Tax=Dechloromonas sp. ARDL1 TaxID=3322121 RepID=UPI003DA6F62A